MGLIGPQGVRGCRSGVGSRCWGGGGRSFPPPPEAAWQVPLPRAQLPPVGAFLPHGLWQTWPLCWQPCWHFPSLVPLPRAVPEALGARPLPHQALRSGPGGLALLDLRVGPGHAQCGRWLAARALSSCKVARGTVVSRPIVCRSCWPLEAWTGPTAPAAPAGLHLESGGNPGPSESAPQGWPLQEVSGQGEPGQGTALS